MLCVILSDTPQLRAGAPTSANLWKRLEPLIWIYSSVSGGVSLSSKDKHWLGVHRNLLNMICTNRADACSGTRRRKKCSANVTISKCRHQVLLPVEYKQSHTNKKCNQASCATMAISVFQFDSKLEIKGEGEGEGRGESERGTWEVLNFPHRSMLC